LGCVLFACELEVDGLSARVEDAERLGEGLRGGGTLRIVVGVCASVRLCGQTSVSANSPFLSGSLQLSRLTMSRRLSAGSREACYYCLKFPQFQPICYGIEGQLLAIVRSKVDDELDARDWHHRT
jgi:hypothetical protein